MIRPILVWPDERLNRVSLPVEFLDQRYVHPGRVAFHKGLVVDLFDTMRASKGIGLAAPQIGILQRVIVLELPGEKPLAMVNPVVSEKSDFKRASEGCLSVPGESAEMERAHRCLVEYQDVEGISWATECFGLYAVAVQHEVDHLDGVVYPELLPRSKREPIRKRMLALKKHSMAWTTQEGLHVSKDADGTVHVRGVIGKDGRLVK